MYYMYYHLIISQYFQDAQAIENYLDGLVQDCSISSVLAMEILQSCTKPPILQNWNPTSNTLVC